MFAEKINFFTEGKLWIKELSTPDSVRKVRTNKVLRLKFVYAKSLPKIKIYEVLLNDLETQKAQLELERGYRLTREDLLAFIEEILKGDVNDKNYQKQHIDHLVSQVFVSDDDTIVYFNIRGEKDIEKMTFDDVKNTKNNIKGVQTQSPLASHSGGF